jgi:hypothetical protein
MDLKNAFQNTITLPCKLCRIPSDEHHNIYDHNYISPVSNKDKLNVKTQRGMKPDNIRDLEVYDSNNDYSKHLSRLDTSATFRSGGNAQTNNIQHGINFKKHNKLASHIIPDQHNGLRGVVDLSLNRELDSQYARQTCDNIPPRPIKTSNKSYVGKKTISNHRQDNTFHLMRCSICNMKESDHKGFSHKFI